MQELEKILEEIEQKIEKAEKIIVKPAHDKLDEVANDTAEAFIEAYKECQDIIRKYMENDGWIPVSQNVPVNNNPVLIWSVNSEQKSEGFSIGSYDYGVWWIGMLEGILTFPTFLKPIAWRPLPEPYSQERSNNHDREGSNIKN